MMRQFLWAVCAIAIMTGCKGKGQAAGSAELADSTATADMAATTKTATDLEAIAKAVEGCNYLGTFQNGAAEVRMGKETFYIDHQGRRVEKPQEEEDPDALKTHYDGKLFGYVDANEKVVIPHQFRFASPFVEGMARVFKDDIYGFINTKGELVIPYQYSTPVDTDEHDFHEGVCAVIVDEERDWYGYIDKTGKKAFEGVFSMVGDFNEGLASVTVPKDNFRSGYIDHTGKMVITLPDQWWGWQFNDGVAKIQNGDNCYIIDKTGRRLFQVDTRWLYPGNRIQYSEGLAVVYGRGKYEGKWGFMDKTGRISFCLHEDNDTQESDLLALEPDLKSDKALDLSNGTDLHDIIYPRWDATDMNEDEDAYCYDINLGAHGQHFQQLLKNLPQKPTDINEAGRLILIDLNYDRHCDLLVCLGHQPATDALHYDAWLWKKDGDDGSFVYVENFREIPNPVIDLADHRFHGSMRVPDGKKLSKWTFAVFTLTKISEMTVVE